MSGAIPAGGARERAGSGPTMLGPVLETLFAVLLVLMSLAIAWFAGYTVYKLYKGQG